MDTEDKDTIGIPSTVVVCPHFEGGTPLVDLQRFDRNGQSWYVLTCAAEHDGEDDGPSLWCGHCVVERDPTLARLPRIEPGQLMKRAAPGQPWQPYIDPEKLH